MRDEGEAEPAFPSFPSFLSTVLVVTLVTPAQTHSVQKVLLNQNEHMTCSFKNKTQKKKKKKTTVLQHTVISDAKGFLIFLVMNAPHRLQVTYTDNNKNKINIISV